MTSTGSMKKAPESANPFIGPRPFRQADADCFFGRERQASEIHSHWLTHRVTVLHGPSAVGRTSLLQGGVLPRLDQTANIDLLQPGRLTQ